QTAFNHFVYFNLGTVLSRVGDQTGALQAYVRAIEISPLFVQPHFNLGSVYEKLGRLDEAISQWNWVVSQASLQQPDERAIRRLALNNLGRLHEQRRQFAEALSCLTQSLEMDPDQADVLHHWIFLRAKVCEWP